jgi:hypothetical protein
MGMNGLVFGEAVARLSGQGGGLGNESRLEPIIDTRSGRQRGLLLESPCERVAVFSKEAAELTLHDVGEARKLLVRAKARRALLYVPIQTIVPNDVRLLATLSKIEIVRFSAAEGEV